MITPSVCKLDFKAATESPKPETKLVKTVFAGIALSVLKSWFCSRVFYTV